MNQPPLDRADFLRTLRRCHTEEQLFSRLTFACLAQYDEAQRPELLDDVRGAAYSLRLPAVEYKTDQWLHRCQDAIDTDRDAFLAAANAEARRENDKMRPVFLPSIFYPFPCLKSSFILSVCSRRHHPSYEFRSDRVFPPLP